MAEKKGKPPATIRRTELSTRKLRWRCDPKIFPFVTTADITDCPINIIGQPRATEALRLGLRIRSDGYNIFVSGEVGTGRSTSVRRQLEAVGNSGYVPEDMVYVHNFNDSDQPRLLRFPAGQGRQFASAMAELVSGLGRSLTGMFESEDFHKRYTERLETAKAHHKEVFSELEKQVQAQGFALVQIQVGAAVRPEVLPLVDGEPAGMDQVVQLLGEGKLSEEEFEKLEERRTELQTKLQKAQKDFRVHEKKLRQDLMALSRDLARPLVEEGVSEIAERFDRESVRAYLGEVQDYVLADLDAFSAQDEAGEPDRDRGRDEISERLRPLQVNVIVKHDKPQGRPVIWETSPSYRNLFGTIEKTRDPSGEWHTDHTRIKAGSILRANGGYLVIDAMDLLNVPAVWPALKRTLRQRILEIQSYDPALAATGVALKPEPVKIDVKVVMIGTPHIYGMLYALDEDFKKIFKIKAEFALDTPLIAEELQNYACFVHKKSQDDDLPVFHRDAVAAVVEEGVRLSGRQDKLTTRFYEVADIIRESGYWAKQDEAKSVRAKHVDMAVDKRSQRHDLLEDLLRRRMAEGTVLLDLGGEKVGQVNGLVVLDLGDHTFGQPTRITAVTAVGTAGIIDIERESEKSGAIHTKGVLILSGLLRARFAQKRPLALSASLCFEQNYGPIDGDSASAAELYALLSSLSGVPLRQGIAVTGSINQNGEIQPIGGVNEKIEGFFDLCRLTGLTGEQGAMIPAANVPHLMLRKDLLAAVRRKEFRIWAVSTVEQGIEVLTGVSAGTRMRDGTYETGTVFQRVSARLEELADAAQRHSLSGKDGTA